MSAEPHSQIGCARAAGDFDAARPLASPAVACGFARSGRRPLAARLGGLLLTLGLAGSAAAQPGPAPANDPGPAGTLNECAADPPRLDRDQYLRALSLDLRGVVPSAAEYASLDAQPDVPEALIDAWLADPAFVAQAVRRHHALLWNNVDGTTLLNASNNLARVTGAEFTGSPAVYYRRNRTSVYRGVDAPCLNEPATFDAEGRPNTRSVAGVRREGWVEVHPYWDPSLTYRVCAFDAETAPLSQSGTDCASRAASGDAGCGCGPDLARCALGNSHRAVNRAMGEAMDRFIAAQIADDRPYTELFSSRRAFVNGPLVHFYKYQTGSTRLTFDPNPMDVELLPDLAFTDADTWVPIDLPPQHAGILTRDAFLIRFQTNRSRANRFFGAFLCSPFQAPAGSLPPADAVAALNPDLQERAGCKYCHALLEPSAAHWGRFTEQGAAWLAPARFPAQRDDCLRCATTGQGCTTECRSFYLTRSYSEAEDRFLGMLNSYIFRREDHVRNVEQGPRLLAFTAVADNRLPACVARSTSEWLLGRSLASEENAWVDEVSRDFATKGYSYRSLVKRIVTDDRYRKVQ